MNTWDSTFDRALKLLAAGLRPVVLQALNERNAKGTSGWEWISQSQVNRGYKALDPNINNWPAEEFLSVIMHDLNFFAPHFQYMASVEDETKEEYTQRGWLNHLLMLRNNKYHPKGETYSPREGEDFLYVGSMLLRHLGSSSIAEELEEMFKIEQARREAAARQRPHETTIPDTLTLSTQDRNTQWVDYRDYMIDIARPWSLSCQILTDSPYFRFGFKLLPEDARVFGDGSLQSYDANLIVHIGRNNWDRPDLGITAQDVFLSSYMSGSSIGGDRHLLRCGPKVDVGLALTLERSYATALAINGQEVFRQVVPPQICRRVLVCAWGDREEFAVEVTKLQLRPVQRA